MGDMREMFDPPNKEQAREKKILYHNERIKEIEQELEASIRETSELFNGLGCTPETLEKKLSTKGNFSDEQWTMICEQRKKFEEKLACSLSQIHSPFR